MVKHKYADRGKAKPKSIKSKAKLSTQRKLSRFGKKQKVGHSGSVTDYIGRTRAIKKLQLSIKDFRRLCILKGIYPRDPTKAPHGREQTYYHVKDIAYLAHEPLLAKFRQTKTFLKRITKSIHRHEWDDAKRMWQNEKPAYRLDHIIKERYPTFPAALGDMDDALSLVHLFASLPASPHVRSDRTSAAKRLSREWQYFCARSHSLRRVFLSLKGIYFQAEVQGVPITWLQPWQFAQEAPADVDYRVMLTFLELYEVTLKFTHYKLFTEGLGLAYPPAIRGDMEDAGGHLAAVDASAPAPTPQQSAAAAVSAALLARAASGTDEEEVSWRGVDPAVEARMRTLKQRMRMIAAVAANTGEAAAAAAAAAASAPAGSAVAPAAPSTTKSRRGASSSSSSLRLPVSSASIYDFVDADGEADGAEAEELAAMSAAADSGAGAGGGDLEAFASGGDDGARLLLEKARAERALTRLFAGCVFFLQREVPREAFEFIICAFRGRVGWDGPGSPYDREHPAVTHVVIDRPLAPGQALLAGKEYVQPQWVADSVNARMLLPTAKYAPGAVLPPHLSPFTDDASEGHVPAYRAELDKLRAAAAVTGRLADVIAPAAAAAASGADAAVAPSRAGADDEAEGENDSDDDDEAGADGDAAEPLDDADEEEEEGDDSDDEEGEGDEEDDEEGSDDDGEGEGEEEDEEDEEAVEAALQSRAPKRAKTDASASASASSAAVRPLSAVEAERRALASSMLSQKQRGAFNRAVRREETKVTKVTALASKAASAAAAGDAGLGKAPGTAAAAAAAKAPQKGGKPQQKQQEKAAGGKRPRA